MLNLIDVFDKSIIDYHMEFHCEAKGAAALLRKYLIRRDLFTEKALKPVIRTYNGPQHASYKFSEYYEEVGIEHERTQIKTPNKMHM